MRHLLPRSLAGQTVALLITGLVITHGVAIVIFSEHRADLLSRADEQHIARHIAAISDIVLRVPDQWQDRIVSLSDDHAFRVYKTAEQQSIDNTGRNDQSKSLNDLLSRQVRAKIRKPISVDVKEVAPGSRPGLGFSSNWFRDHFSRLIYGHDRDRAVFVSVPLSKDQRLNFSTMMPLTDGPGWEQALAMAMLFVIAVLLLSLWIIKKLSAPLNRLAGAATAFAHNVYAPALPESGPSEVQRAAPAFNDMQIKIRQLVENRAQILAAISHDLRTPLTTVRLRAENVTQPELRMKMLAALEEMDTMLSSTLTYAREGSDNEAKSLTDIASLVAAICDDMSDNGHKLTYNLEHQILANCRPIAIKRALSNLIDNAVIYGHSAHVSAIAKAGDYVEITIDDEGPGIPALNMEQVFLPYYRLEASRNQNTGGVGLGMAIAQMVIDAHRGTIQLSNRPQGGLRVRVRIPHSNVLNDHNI